MDSSSNNATEIPVPRRSLWSRFVAFLVTVFVVWHLFILIIRNPIDLWWRDIEAWGKQQAWWESVEPSYQKLDRWTWKYENFLGVEQGWTMFQSPLARGAPFLAARIVFADGTEEILLSRNDLGAESFFRVGGWRQRKIEDLYVHADSQSLRNAEEERLICSAYVRWSLRRWRENNSDDPRVPERVILLRRRIYFPSPDEPPRPADAPLTYVIAEFDPDGTLR